MFRRHFAFLICPALLLATACGEIESEASYPKRQEEVRLEQRGKLTGDGLSLGGSDKGEENSGGNPLGVNSFLWRATLDTLAFMPLASADPFGGVIITDWYEDPNAQGERFKATALILDRQLRADGIKLSLFKQQQTPDRGWIDVKIEDKIARGMEDAILTRARQLRVTSAK
jgi:hypothetical protein